MISDLFLLSQTEVELYGCKIYVSTRYKYVPIKSKTLCDIDTGVCVWAEKEQHTQFPYCKVVVIIPKNGVSKTWSF